MFNSCLNEAFSKVTMRFDVKRFIICTCNIVEYLDKEMSYKNSIKEIIIVIILRDIHVIDSLI